MPVSGLDEYVEQGHALLDESDPVRAHNSFNSWVVDVKNWLRNCHPDSGLTAQWAAQSASNLVVGGAYHDDSASWYMFKLHVNRRLIWLGNLPTRVKLVPTEIRNATARTGSATLESSTPTLLKNRDKKKVFVVHGRNNLARAAMFNFLRSLSLEPIEWSQAVLLTGKGSPFVGEILDAAFNTAQAVVVLMTPDDIAYLVPESNLNLCCNNN
jgi:hypothetical protein